MTKTFFNDKNILKKNIKKYQNHIKQVQTP